MVFATYIRARVVQVRQRVKRKRDRISATVKKMSLTSDRSVCRTLYKKRRAGKWPAKVGCQGDRLYLVERRQADLAWRAGQVVEDRLCWRICRSKVRWVGPGDQLVATIRRALNSIHILEFFQKCVI